MHRVILGLTDPTVLCDHIDGDGLNNRRSNLRCCVATQNARNCKLSRNNTSGFKGVSFHLGAQKWIASIVADNRYIYLGLFSTAEEAAAAYDAACRKHHGEFARPNR